MKKVFFRVTPSQIVKIVAYAAFAVFLICTMSSFIPSFGYKGAVPDLILCAVIAVAYFENERAAAIFGMLAGFASESVGSTGFSILPLFYMMTGCVAAFLFCRVLQKHFGAYMLYCAVFMVLRSAVTLISVTLDSSDIAFDALFSRVLVGEYVFSVSCAPVVFVLTRLVSFLLSIGRDGSDVKM